MSFFRLLTPRLLAYYPWRFGSGVTRGTYFSRPFLSRERRILSQTSSPQGSICSAFGVDAESSVFQRFFQVLSPCPEVDLFASSLIYQLPKYCVRYLDPHAWKVDALSFQWTGLLFYAFPPFSILPTVLEKIALKGADVALVPPPPPPPFGLRGHVLRSYFPFWRDVPGIFLFRKTWSFNLGLVNLTRR